MKPTAEELDLGWRCTPFAVAALCAAALMGAAWAIHASGLLVGAGVLAGAGMVALAGLQRARLDGPQLRLRTLRHAFAARFLHARGVGELTYRRGLGPCALRVVGAEDERDLRLEVVGPTPRAAVFRQLALWLIVHGRRQVRIDPALLDALASMPDHESAGLPHDTSHA